MASFFNTKVSVGGDIPTLLNVDALRNYLPRGLRDGASVIVSGQVEPGDKNGGVYVWQDSNNDPDDGLYTVKPVASIAAGRWVQMFGKGADGQGLADVTAPGGAALIGTNKGNLQDLLDDTLTYVTPQMLGAKDDGSTSAHAAFLSLSNSNKTMRVPAGTYLIDNSEPRQIDFYSGEVLFEPGAKLVFTDQTKIGFFFFKGSPKVRGVTLTTRDAPTERQHNAAMLRFDYTTDAVVSDVVIERGAGAGILVLQGTGFRGNNIVIRNTLADGFDFFNASDFTLSDLYTENTGDDGLGVVSYKDGPQIQRGTLSNINVKQSRTRGISFIGAANVVLTNFLIEETQGDGLIVERDDTAVTHTPDHIQVSGGIIRRPGQRTIDTNYTGDRFGVKVGNSGTVIINDVTIIDGKSRGFSATSAETNAHLSIDNIRVEGCGDEGFFVFNHPSWTYGTITAIGTRTIGIRSLNVARMIGTRRIAINATNDNSARAIWDANNGFQMPGTAVIEDTRNPAKGIVYRVEGNGKGSAGQVEWNISNGGYYEEVVAPNMTIPPSYAPRRNDVSPGSGDIVLSPNDALDRRINDALTQEVAVILPQFGTYHGMTVSVTRYDGSGTFGVVFKDPNNSNNIVTSIPAGSAMKNSVMWDVNQNAWRAAGKTTL